MTQQVKIHFFYGLYTTALEKKKWYTLPMKVLNISSFEKQKEYTLALLRNSD